MRQCFVEGDTGLEQPPKTRGICDSCGKVTPNPTPNELDKRGLLVDIVVADDLEHVAKKWNALPQHIRNAILTLVHSFD